MNRKLFIVFEGLDRSGKSTQVEMLHKYLSSKYPCNILKFPDRQTTTGKLINSYLKNETNVSDQVIHLLFTTNRWEIVPKMQKLLDNNEIIICDRYSYSGIAYSAAKGMDLQWCKNVEYGLPQPDIVFFMDVACNETSTRQGFGHEIYETVEFQKKVNGIFQDLMTDPDTNWKRINAKLSISEIHEEIKKTVDNLLK